MIRDKIFKYTYYVYLVLITLQNFLEQTLIDFSAIRQPLRWLSFMTGILIIFKIVMDWKDKWKTEDIISGILGPGLIILCCLIQPNKYVIPYAILILGAKGQKTDKVLGTYLMVTVLLTLLTISLCFAGKIDNIITYRYENSTHMRQSLGFVYATCLTSHILALIMVWTYLRSNQIKWQEILIIAALGIFCYWIAEARIAAFCIELIAVVLLLFQWKNNKTCIKIFENKAVKYFLSLIGIFLTVLSVLLGLLYQKDNTVWQKIASLSSQRINMNAMAFERYVPGLFGQSISVIGEMENGQRAVSENYFVLNTSYISILFKLGIIGLIAVLFIWTVITVKEYRQKNYIRVLLFAVFSLFCFFEHRLLEFSNNPFLLLLFMEPALKKEGEEENEDSRRLSERIDIERKYHIKAILTIVVLSFVIEIIGFNYKAVLSITNDDVSYADCLQDTPNVERSEYGTLHSEDNPATLYAYDIPTYIGLESVYLDISYFTYEDSYHRLYEPYQVDIYDVAYSKTEPIVSTFIDPRNAADRYIPLIIGGITQNLKLDFHFQKNRHFVLNEFSFNTARPFEIHGIRILMVFIVLIIVYGLYNIIKNKKVNK